MNAKRQVRNTVYDFHIDIEKMLLRPRVERVLQDSMEHPLTIIHAPTGYGKTTAASQFVKTLQAQVVYLGLNELDNDPQRFWKHLSGLYQRLSPDIGERLAKLDFPASRAQFMQFTEIIGELLEKGNHILLLDDFHAAESPELSELIVKLISLRLDGLHLFVMSRTLPKFCSLDMKVKGLITEITKEQLRFDTAEIIGYYNMLGIELTDTYARQIGEYSEGWASIIYLSRMYAASSPDRLLTVPDFDIDRLIENTIFQVYDQETQEFLIQLCILDQFDLELCSYLTENKNAYKLILRITTDNSLIKVSEDKRTYSMHSLFRDFLRKKLNTHSAQYISALHCKAGEYYAYKDDVLMALIHFDKAQEYTKIANLILESRYMRIFANQEFATVIRYMAKMPEEIYSRNPMLYLILAHAYSYIGQVGQSMEIIVKVSGMCENPDMPADTRRKLQGEILMIQAMLSFNNYDAMLDCCRKAYELIPEGTELISPDGSYTFGNPSVLYLYYNCPGGLDRAVRAFLEDFPVWEKMSDLGCGADFLMKAEAAFERCDYEQAESDAYRAIYKAQLKNQDGIVLGGKLLITRICAAKGKYGAAAVNHRDMHELVGRRGAAVFGYTRDLCDAAYAVLCGNPAAMPNWISTGEFFPDGITGIGGGMEYLSYVHVLLQEKDYLKIESVIPAMLGTYGVFGYQHGIIRANLAAAVAGYHLYGLEKALPYFAAAIQICESDQVLMPYLEYGEYLLPLIHEIKKHGKIAEIALTEKALDELARRMREYGADLQKFRAGYQADHPHVPVSGTIKLTKRETEILKLIIQGMNGEEIAKELFVTPINVRIITSKLYKKLGVSSRVEAVKTALENNLIK